VLSAVGLAGCASAAATMHAVAITEAATRVFSQGLLK
jgi:hypothetical protein